MSFHPHKVAPGEISPDQPTVSAPAKTGLSRGDVLRLLAVNLLWALCYPLIVIGLASAPPLHFAALRALLAGVVLLATGFAVRRPLPSSLSAWATLGGIGLATTALGFGGMFTAGGRISPGIATVLANVQPLLAAMIGAAVLSNPLKGRTLLAILIGFAGVSLVAVPGFMSPGPKDWGVGAALVLFAAVGVAAGNVMLKRLAGSIDPWMAMGIQFVLGSIPLFAVSDALEPWGVVAWSGTFLVVLSLLAVFGSALVFLLWFGLLQRNELNRLNIYTFLTPVFALLIGMLSFGERLTGLQWLGALVVVMAAVMAGRKPAVANASM